MGIDIILEQPVQLLKGVDIGEIKGRNPATPKSAEVPLDLPLAGAVPYAGVLFHDPEVAEDER